jgi:hypothetical protein
MQMGYLTVLSGDQIIRCQIKLVNNIVGKIYKVEVVALFEIISRHLSEGTEKAKEKQQR